MPNRVLHYERAFGHWLRRRQLPHIAVNQLRRPVLDGLPVKNFDYLVQAVDGTSYLVEVKGKLFPYRYGRRRVYFENWIHRSDLEGLSAWEEAFDDNVTGLLVFAYHIVDPWDTAQFPTTFTSRGQTYGFVAVTLETYRRYSRCRSAGWQAYNIPKDLFRELAVPADDVLLQSVFHWDATPLAAYA